MYIWKGKSQDEVRGITMMFVGGDRATHQIVRDHDTT